MALREIRQDGDEALYSKCRPVKEINERVRQMLDDMVETMYRADGGGLAANQVGVLKRLVVMDVGEGLKKLVNPEIVCTEGEQVESEGCLSFPDTWGKVRRPEKVVVRALDESGKEVTVTGEGLAAVCLCHEIDHLNGIVFVDKIIEMDD